MKITNLTIDRRAHFHVGTLFSITVPLNYSAPALITSHVLRINYTLTSKLIYKINHFYYTPALYQPTTVH